MKSAHVQLATHVAGVPYALFSLFFALRHYNLVICVKKKKTSLTISEHIRFFLWIKWYVQCEIHSPAAITVL